MASVLFICLGNICRSPMAEGIFRFQVDRDDLSKNILVDSAGTGSWHIGNPPDPRAKATAIANGVDFICGPSESVILLDLSNGRRIHLQQQDPFNLTVVWTDPPRKMVCLEPWTSPRDSLRNGERLLELEPDEIQTLTCRFSID